MGWKSFFHVTYSSGQLGYFGPEFRSDVVHYGCGRIYRRNGGSGDFIDFISKTSELFQVVLFSLGQTGLRIPLSAGGLSTISKHCSKIGAPIPPSFVGRYYRNLELGLHSLEPKGWAMGPKWGNFNGDCVDRHDACGITHGSPRRDNLRIIIATAPPSNFSPSCPSDGDLFPPHADISSYMGGEKLLFFAPSSANQVAQFVCEVANPLITRNGPTQRGELNALQTWRRKQVCHQDT
ncbi:LOW QUALITY PROTEIN: hypothetical protein M514_23106 [Trichuris suis]|uniref:Uncharacterized protein n=1 Tax=Trichuris suis TaxID=68888 RepID=A0A085N5A2_9BILA|nr:LOW QUALITY PROTEIN: hypothetical protein M514_23106 [Trichuris suis]